MCFQRALIKLHARFSNCIESLIFVHCKNAPMHFWFFHAYDVDRIKNGLAVQVAIKKQIKLNSRIALHADIGYCEKSRFLFVA